MRLLQPNPLDFQNTKKFMAAAATKTIEEKVIDSKNH